MAIKNIRTEEDIRKAIVSSISKSEALKKLNLDEKSGTMYRYLNNAIRQYNIDVSHMLGRGYLKGKTHNFTKGRDLSDILIENSTYNSGPNLKRKLIKNNLLENKCSVCSIVDWQGKPLSLQIDHINGINNDNRIKNLRLICPNCHSQTSTYCGRNIKCIRNYCVGCNKNIPKTATRCYPCYLTWLKTSPDRPKKSFSKRRSFKIKQIPTCNICGVATRDSKNNICKMCFNSTRKTKIQWPDNQTLQSMVEETSFLAVGRKLGVSDNAVRKRLRKI